MSDRPTNPEICEAFRKLLTDGFYVSDVDGVPSTKSHTLTATKPWRGDLWKAFAEIEERLCPLEVETRRRLKAGTHE